MFRLSFFQLFIALLCHMQQTKPVTGHATHYLCVACCFMPFYIDRQYHFDRLTIPPSPTPLNFEIRQFTGRLLFDGVISHSQPFYIANRLLYVVLLIILNLSAVVY